jgi:hypothetical protein
LRDVVAAIEATTDDAAKGFTGAVGVENPALLVPNESLAVTENE